MARGGSCNWDIRKSLYERALALAAAKHNAGSDYREGQQQREQIAEPREDRCRIGRRWKHRVDHSGLLPGDLLEHFSFGIDDRADPGRSRTDHWQSLLGSAEACLGEVLRRTP